MIAFFNKYFSRHVRLVCVTVQANDPSKAEGYELTNILSDSPLRYVNLFYFFTLRRILKQQKASVLVIEHPYYGWLGVLLKWFTGIRLAVHSHNIESLRFKTLGKWWWNILWSYERFTHRQANYNFFIQAMDKEYAIRKFGLKPERCTIVTYGIEFSQPPSKEEREEAANKIRAAHNIAQDEYILLFNGAFNYKPNLDALNRIIDTINPMLQQAKGFKYRIIICGSQIPPHIAEKNFPDITIAGFVDDINLYLKGANTFLNPVIGGGGIKTKLVEALGYNCNAVSTVDGAIGIPPAICNEKLLLADDHDWKGFAHAIQRAVTIFADMPPAFYQHFYWDHNARRAAELIEHA